ncbi:hypothetical protein K7X08_033676 [Anisodus acutangulus]|uniref:Amino acid transporter transmembrane domain-containing protein n=1 Tax=Anisodus acutangulus TaxID=402998 RepID=A0A9Q1M245_9SOLA|nr:hypothetical protein K7X08_033676 [Anisodus acutangulus]
MNGTILMPRLLPDVFDMTSFLKLFTVVPVLVTAYICHYNDQSSGAKLTCSLLKCVCVDKPPRSVSKLASLFGFLLFGDATLDDVLANFDINLGIPLGSMLNDVVRVSYAAHLMLVFPIVFYPLRLNLDSLLFPSARPLTFDNMRFASISSGLIAIIFLGANFIPSICDAFQFTGATAAVCIGFIFPAAVTLSTCSLSGDHCYCAHSPYLVHFILVFFRSPTRLLDIELLPKMEQDHLAESLNDLFTNVSTMIRGELQETNNVLVLVEKMNTRVAEEYKGFGDVASGLRIFVEQLKSKSGSFDEYVQQIDTIEQQVTEFEAVISMLDKYVSLLESKVQSAYQIPPS